jgi:hypothetical protein
MTNTIRPRKRRHRAAAARQALRLCEANLTSLTWDTPNSPRGVGHIQGSQCRVNPITTRAALRAVGVPPFAAAVLRRRLRLIPELEAEQ